MRLKDIIFRQKSFIYGGIFIILLFAPLVLPTYHLMLFESGLTFAIMGLGFNLLLRYTGLLSFGPSIISYRTSYSNCSHCLFRCFGYLWFYMCSSYSNFLFNSCFSRLNGYVCFPSKTLPFYRRL